MAWEYETFGPDGQCELFGVNIFDYDWQTTGKRVKVKDPIYHQDHTFEVWQGSSPTACGDFIWRKTDERSGTKFTWPCGVSWMPCRAIRSRKMP